MAFRKHVYTQIHLPATPAQVWCVLNDTPAYPDWNPFILQLAGRLEQGAVLDAQIQNMRFRPTVLQAIPNQLLKWRGKLLIKGLFDGEHVFRLEAQTDGSTLLHHEEYFSGLLVPLFSKQLDGATKAGFEAMNQALKQRLKTLSLSA
jgi:hypothetical protein